MKLNSTTLLYLAVAGVVLYLVVTKSQAQTTAALQAAAAAPAGSNSAGMIPADALAIDAGADAVNAAAGIFQSW